MARLEYLDGRETRPSSSPPPDSTWSMAISGFRCKPKHPVLAQIFIDWRLDDDAQFPDVDAWGITKGAWAELQEGFLGPSYEGDIPDWIEDDYFNFYPTTDQLAQKYKQVDWDYYAAHQKDWNDYWLAEDWV